jgi:L-lactate dehydrogenase complex protein LldG
MSSRDKILTAVKSAQPPLWELPSIAHLDVQFDDNAEQFTTILQGIGGKVVPLSSESDLANAVQALFPLAKRIVSTLPSLADIAETSLQSLEPHTLENVDLAIISAQFGVAENGAVWVTDEESQVRVLPFICQHLAAVLPKTELVANMHEAYQRIGNASYPFGAFIAGPSKTADIEQSLVLGAHGPKSMTIFLIE